MCENLISSLLRELSQQEIHFLKTSVKTKSPENVEMACSQGSWFSLPHVNPMSIHFKGNVFENKFTGKLQGMANLLPN